MDKIIIGNVAWLRNDYRQDIFIGGLTYPTLEHAYQAAKIKDVSIKHQIANTDDVREARKIGRANKQSDTFDREKAMEALLRRKFTDEDLGLRLAQLGDDPIVMEGYDDFWGTGQDGDGQNVMGEILQTIRSELQLVYGIEKDETDGCDDCSNCNCCDTPEAVPLLKDAILNAPDEELATACQTLFDMANGVIPFLDANDYNAAHIAKKTGAPIEKVTEMIGFVQKFQAALTNLSELLETPSEKEVDEEDEDEEDDEDDQSVID